MEQLLICLFLAIKELFGWAVHDKLPTILAPDAIADLTVTKHMRQGSHALFFLSIPRKHRHPLSIEQFLLPVGEWEAASLLSETPPNSHALQV
jgi:hypothetical protein